ncbi:alpha/beta fold hydrolase [Spelaeicoccus albus]|uniref:Pimeloyl-ACP methyl ester carboxylesterase n=1 Tax=Spelaeicoccus albus TaxID=1280376 RepID=A0A7Z0IIN1_9MICO|nr:alpha/beta hydrolase [Spelaeicoccus albus]NYI68614.1 pimeloyl-ACP methyl ester carboxylesterase [Spelaeicoccus albus]
MDILLIAGLWLDDSAWDDVAAKLADLGHRPVPITLPGQGDGDAATLDDQVAAVVEAVDAASGKPVVVGHSAASTLAWLAADARAGRVAKTVLIGGFPTTAGEAYADFFPAEGGVMPFPGWEPFDGPDSADLSEDAKRRIAAAAIPVPEAVSTAAVAYTDDARFDVPTVLICPEYGPADAKEWIEGGDVPELAAARHVEYFDIDSGHWPMYTKPAELAGLLAEAAK